MLFSCALWSYDVLGKIEQQTCSYIRLRLERHLTLLSKLPAHIITRLFFKIYLAQKWDSIVENRATVWPRKLENTSTTIESGEICTS